MHPPVPRFPGLPTRKWGIQMGPGGLACLGACICIVSRFWWFYSRGGLLNKLGPSFLLQSGLALIGVAIFVLFHRH
jgi:hypothetical protein